MVVAKKRFAKHIEKIRSELKVVTHPITNPTQPAKIFSQTPLSPPSDFLLSVFSLYPHFASYCEYHMSSTNKGNRGACQDGGTCTALD